MEIGDCRIARHSDIRNSGMVECGSFAEMPNIYIIATPQDRNLKKRLDRQQLLQLFNRGIENVKHVLQSTG